MMYALIRDGQLEAFVASTEGYDLAGLTVIEVEGDVRRLRYRDGRFVERDPTPAEETRAALDADARWQAMRDASPDQVQAWLDANVTDLASARRVLRLLILAVQRLAKTR